MLLFWLTFISIFLQSFGLAKREVKLPYEKLSVGTPNEKSFSNFSPEFLAYDSDMNFDSMDNEYYYDYNEDYYDDDYNMDNMTFGFEKDGFETYEDDENDIMVESIYDDLDNYTIGNYDYSWRPNTPTEDSSLEKSTTASSFFTVTTTKVASLVQTSKSPVLSTTYKPMKLEPKFTARKTNFDYSTTPSDRSKIESLKSRSFYTIRLNITSLLYDPALENSGSYIYRQVVPKVTNALYQEVLNEIDGTHTIIFVKFGKPVVLATAYIATESTSPNLEGNVNFEDAAQKSLQAHLKSGVLGEFTIDRTGFEFNKTDALDASATAGRHNDLFAEPTAKNLYDDDAEAALLESDGDGAVASVNDVGRSDVKPQDSDISFRGLGGSHYASTNVGFGDYSPCLPEEIACDGRCANRCDEYPECRDGRDEENCPILCAQDEITCANHRQCVRSDQRCDGRDDCDDASDEYDCSGANPLVFIKPQQLLVRPGTFVKLVCHVADLPPEQFSAEWIRSGQEAMPIGTSIDSEIIEFTVETEKDAGAYLCRVNGAQGVAVIQLEGGNHVRIEPDTLYASAGSRVELTCILESASGRRYHVHWSRLDEFGNPRTLPPGAYTEGNRLIFTPESTDDGGEFNCRIEGADGKAYITISRNIPGIPTSFCKDDERRCPDGHCFPNSKLCDGHCDCSGCNDEEGCDSTGDRRGGNCHPNEWRCKVNTNKCIVVYWRCDGQDDCSGDGIHDNSDEEGCGQWPLHADQGSCSNFTMWQCADRRQCVQRSWLCADDRQHVQCRDGSDYDCTSPRVIEPPVKENFIPHGGTLRCRCVTEGRPFPMIVWRYNWQHLPDDRRIKVKDYYNGTSELIIHDVSRELEGAYTCEALNLKDRVLAVPDCQLIVEMPSHNCYSGTFNANAHRQADCKKCWCSGVSDQCQSSNLFIGSRRLDHQPPDVVDEDNTEADKPHWRRHNSMWAVDDYERAFGAYFDQNGRRDLYVRISGSAVDSWLNSYGGFLNYSFSFTVHRPPFHSLPKAEILLIRKPDSQRQRVYYNYLLTSPSSIRPIIDQDGHDYQLHVRLTEGPFTHSAWRKIKKPEIRDEGGRDVDFPPNLVSRDEFMHALANLEAVLIRISYAGDRGQKLTTFGNVHVTTASHHGSERAVLVEECVCPPGYLGMSCEKCDRPRYFRTRHGKCERCQCHNHAETCDEAGICINCKHNTEGDHCERCRPGFTGNARQGTPDDCQTMRDACHPEGSLTKYPDPATDRCQCKPGVMGRLCDQCMPGYFHLHSEGCLRCFCSGHNVSCTGSSWRRKTIVSVFDRHSEHAGGFGLAEMTGLTAPGEQGTVFPEERPAINLTSRIQMDHIKNEIYFDEFSGNENGKIFWWRLPSLFQSHKVTAYGGKLRFTVSYKPDHGSQPISAVAHGNLAATKLARLYGNNFELLSKLDAPMISEFKAPDYRLSFDILMNEHNWLYISGDSFQEKSREELLMALSDVSHIQILATFGTRTLRSDLSDVALTIADRSGNGIPAPEVEMCDCYTAAHTEGTSCELCKPGYYHSIEGLYLGTCKRCHCHNHAQLCEDRTGYCINCQHFTEGDQCEHCISGYTGDARRGTPNDCTPIERPKPVVNIVQGREIYVRKGDRLTLTCHLTGVDPEGRLFTWQRNPPGDSGLESKIRDIGGRTLELTINHVDWSDAGEYNCRYDHIDGSAVDYIRVKVVGLEVDPESAEVLEGDSHFFECRTLGFTLGRSETIHWRKDSSSLPQGARLYDSNGKKIEIVSITEAHEGSYTCAITFHGIDLSATGHLSMTPDVVHPFVRFETTVYYAYKGEHVRIGCTLLQGKPIRHFEIRRMGERNQTLPFHRDQRVDRNGRKSLTLNIEGFAPEHAGPYKCEALGSEGRSDAVVVVRHVELEILPGPRQNMREGQEIEFTCQIKGEEHLDDIDLVWVDANDVDRVIHNSHSFVLRAHKHMPNQISRLCVAKRRSDGRRIASTPLEVSIYHPRPHSLRVFIEMMSPGGPRRLRENERIRVKVGERLELWCVAEGFPKPGAQFEAEPHRPLQITHQNSNAPLFFSPLDKPEESRTVAKLVINSITPVDRGSFVCSGRNGRGRQERTANVRVNVEVIDDPVRLQLTVEPEPLRVGSRVTIKCTAISGGSNKILEIDSPSHRSDIEIYQTDGESSLVIPHLQSTHAGLYSCYPRDDPSTRVSKSVVVVTILGPEDIQAGGSGSLTCRADGLPDSLSIQWVREHGQAVPRKHSFDEAHGILHLQEFDSTDAGSYVCQIKNNNDGKVVAEASISVMLKLINFQINIGRPERIYLSEEIALHCTASHRFELTQVQWTTPRGSVSTRQREGSNIRCADQICQQLIVVKWDDADNGHYQCSAGDAHGNTGSASVDLTHRGIRNFAVKIVVDGESYEDRRFIMTCGGESGGAELHGKDGRRIQINFQREDGGSWDGISAENNQLIFHSLSPHHTGTYVCHGDDGYGNRAIDRYSLHVVARPRFSGDPEGVINLFVGEHLHLDCTANGYGTLRYAFEKDGRNVGHHAYYDVSRVAVDDAGRYRCTVDNDAGSIDRDFTVNVYEPRVSIDVQPQRPIAGQYCTMTCSVSGLPPGARITDYRWYRGDRLVHQGDSTYMLPSPSIDDSGDYGCEISIRGLVFTGRLAVTITGIPPEIRIVPADSIITVVYGETLMMNCSASGQPQPSVSWSGPRSVGSALEQRDGVLQMRVTSVDFGGFYTCTAHNSVGQVSSKVRVIILGGPPHFEKPEVIHTALVGSNVRIDCGSYLTSSDPDIVYKWSLRAGRPITTSRATINNNILQIYDARLADESEYECVASNSHGSDTLLLRLYIERRLPSFRQATSYMKVKDGIQKPAEYLSVEMTFRPESPNGRILYKGASDSEADFFCLALKNSQLYLEASAGAGSGGMPIHGAISSTLAMNKWHTVRISRKHSEVTVVVDGSSKVLTLPRPNEAIDFRANFLYLGALPPRFTPRASSRVHLRDSFIGAVSRLKVQDRVIDFSPTSEHYDAVDASFESFQTCIVDGVECQHGGICQNFDNERGFRCVCHPGAFGEFCERQTPDRCYKSLCGEGICLQKAPAGYQCLCPAGFQGRHCEIRDVVVTVPEFNMTSFVRTTLKDFHSADMRIGLSFRPHQTSTGQILFFAQSSVSSDFFLLSMTSTGRVRFTFSVLGANPSTIESDSAVQFRDWNSAIAECDQNGGQLIVNGGPKKVVWAPVGGRRRFTIGVDKTVYVGGVDPTMDSLARHSALSDLSGFLGCMKWLYHGPDQVPLLRPEGDASGLRLVAAYHVVQCHQPSTGCDARPCQNNGLCHDKPGSGHYCSCQTGYHGENCENVVDVCRQLELSDTPACSPPNGECIAGENVYKCSCKLPYHGDNCEYAYSGTPSQPAFVGSGWLELDKSILAGGASSAGESIRVKFRTSAEHGVIFWHGQPPYVYGDVADFLAIAVTDGHLHARVRLSPLRTSTLTLTSVNRVDDGAVHEAIIERRGGSLQMQLDDDRLLGQSFSNSVGDTDLNANGNVYIGGAPKLDQMSGGAFHKHFDGCVTSLTINGRPIDFSRATEGRDVRECASIRSRFYFNSRSRHRKW